MYARKSAMPKPRFAVVLAAMALMLATVAAVPPAAAAQDSAAQVCSGHHKFGAEPVDVAKTADGQAVLARLSWGHHPSIGCCLVLDNTALTTLQTPTDDQTPDDTTDDTDDQTTPAYTAIAAGGSFFLRHQRRPNHRLLGRQPLRGRPTRPQANKPTSQLATRHSCAITTDQTVTCWNREWVDEDHVPVKYDGPAGKYTAVSTYSDLTQGSLDHACALAVEGTIVCWGMWDMRTA